jgi:hypothetical protein
VDRVTPPEDPVDEAQVAAGDVHDPDGAEDEEGDEPGLDASAHEATS